MLKRVKNFGGKILNKAKDFAVSVANSVQKGLDRAFTDRTAWGTKAEKRDKSEVIQPSFKYKGNIDLNSLPTVQNEDGSQSTVLSFSIQDERDGKETLIPQVVNGKIVDEAEAIRHYYETGEHLGKFDTIKEANKYAKELHKEEEKRISQAKKENQISANPLLYKTNEDKKEAAQAQGKGKNNNFENIKVIGENGIEKIDPEESSMWGDVIERAAKDISNTRAKDLKNYLPKIGINTLLGAKQGFEKAGQYYSETMPEAIDKGLWGEGVSQIDRNKEIAKEQLIREKGLKVINTEEYEHAGESSFQKWAREDQKEIDKIIEEAPNGLLRKLAEQAPSFGSSTAGGALGTVGGPFTSFAYYFGSSGQDYYDDAKQRGMSDEDAFLYSGIMGSWEGASDSLITSQNVNFLKSKISGTELNGGIMKLIGNQFVENAAQEGITDPIAEIMAGLTGGKEYMQTEDLTERMVESAFWGGIQGALSGGLTGVVGSTITSSEQAADYLIDKIQEAIDKRGRENFARDFVKAANDTMSKAAVKMAKDEINASQFTPKQREEIIRFINNSDSDAKTIKRAVLVYQRINELRDAMFPSARGRVTADTWQQGIMQRAENSRNGIESTNSTEAPQTQERYTRLLENNTQNQDEQSKINVSTSELNDILGANIEDVKTMIEDRYNSNKEAAEQYGVDINSGKISIGTREGDIDIFYSIGKNGDIKILGGQKDTSSSKTQNITQPLAQQTITETKNIPLKNVDENIQKIALGIAEERAKGQFEQNGQFKKRGNLTLGNYTINYTINENGKAKITKVVENIETTENQPSTMQNEPLLESNQQTIQEENKMAENATSQETGEISKKSEDVAVPIDMEDNERAEKVNKELLKASKSEGSNIVQKLTPQEAERKGEILETIGKTEEEWNKLSQYGKERTLENYSLDEITEEDRDLMLNKNTENESDNTTAQDPETQEILDDIRANSIGAELSQEKLKTEEELEAERKENEKNKLLSEDISDLGEIYSLKDRILNRPANKKIQKELDTTPTRILKKEARTVDRVNWGLGILKAALVDRGWIFEDMDFRTKDLENKSAQAAYQSTLTATDEADYAILNGREYTDENGNVQKTDSLLDILNRIPEDLRYDFEWYARHKQNIDRMTLKERAQKDAIKLQEQLNELISRNEKYPVENFDKLKRAAEAKIKKLNEQENHTLLMGENEEVVSAEQSEKEVKKYEKEHPEFKDRFKELQAFLDENNKILLKADVINQDAIDTWKLMYPNYMPVNRAGKFNETISVPLNANETTINNPIHRSKGGTGNINPLFVTIAERTRQAYKAARRNELANVIAQKLTAINELSGGVDGDIDLVNSIDGQDESIEDIIKGDRRHEPQLVFFKNGKRMRININDDIAYALGKPNELLSALDQSILLKPVQKLSSIRRGLLTEYKPTFIFTNGSKDIQDAIINSQHTEATIAKIPEAEAQIAKKGYWYREYMANGGNKLRAMKDGAFDTKAIKLLEGKGSLPQKAINNISAANRAVELTPRLAEYIASREAGRNIKTSMLDAARVTTNFAASGEITRFLDRNGFTFLNANVQGMAQQVRNVKEGKAKGFKGMSKLLFKLVAANVPAMFINGLIWGDDDDYEKLSDYVKDRYYIVGKVGDHTFLRIPKGRINATIQKWLYTGYEYAARKKEFNINNAIDDLSENIAFTVDNIGLGNPLDNNIVAPLKQVKDNKTWYDTDIVPNRFSKQEDVENIYTTKTDEFSKLLGKALGSNEVTEKWAKDNNINPITLNYLLKQYGGGVTEIPLAALTPATTNGAPVVLTPFANAFTTNSVINSQTISDYWNKRAELDDLASKINPTSEDKVKNQYFTSFGKEFSELYDELNKAQNSDMSRKEKFKKIEGVQSKINSLMEKTMKDVDNAKIKGNTAEIGDKMYYKDNSGKWNEIKEENKPSGISVEKYGKYKNDINSLTQKKREREGKDTADLTDAEKTEYLLNGNYTKAEKEIIYENMIKKDDKKYDGLKVINPDTNINDYLEYKSNSFSKKAESEAYLNGTDYNDIERLYLRGASYKLTRDERSALIRYMNTLSQSESDAILDGLSAYNGKRDDNGVWQWSK